MTQNFQQGKWQLFTTWFMEIMEVVPAFFLVSSRFVQSQLTWGPNMTSVCRREMWRAGWHETDWVEGWDRQNMWDVTVRQHLGDVNLDYRKFYDAS